MTLRHINREKIKSLAHASGFDLCGVVRPEPIPEAAQRLRDWLDRGYHASMDWITKSWDRRVDPGTLMDNARSVIMLGVNYYQPDTPKVPDGYGRVSRYARGRDYHKVLARHCKQLIARIEEEISREAVPVQYPQFKFWVDFGPFMERAYAEQAGLGYVGKHGLLINKQFGSWFFLAEIVTDLDLEPDQSWPGDHGRCGTCRRCLDACPTGAIVKDGVVDSNRCLSYWSIETSGEMPPALAEAMGSTVFGCDICQDVCPHNQHRAKLTVHEDLRSEAGVGEFVELRRIENLDSDQAFLDLVAGTPLTRPKRSGLVRNARIVRANQARE